MVDMKVLATGLRFPEGPVALADGSIALVEIARGTVSRVTPDGKVTVIADLGGGPNGLAFGPDGALYVCNNGGFEWQEEPGNKIMSRRHSAGDALSKLPNRCVKHEVQKS
jgi:gluconolactonase